MRGGEGGGLCTVILFCMFLRANNPTPSPGKKYLYAPLSAGGCVLETPGAVGSFITLDFDSHGFYIIPPKGC